MRIDLNFDKAANAVVSAAVQHRSRRLSGFRALLSAWRKKISQRNREAKPYRPIVAGILNKLRPQTVLDAPSGSGFLRQFLNADVVVDGVDFYCARPDGYRNFWKFNLDTGLPDGMSDYDCIVCCEAISYLGNPLAFLKSARRQLRPGGVLIVTTPSIWYPGARLQFLLRGFFPAFPWPLGKADRGDPFHIHPYSYPQLYLYLKLSGFTNVRLHPVDHGPKHLYEWVLGIPQVLYCYAKLKRSGSEEEKSFWKQAGSIGSVYGRRIVVTAEAAIPGELAK